MMPESFGHQEPNDIRFQYTVIQSLADSVRQTATSVERLTTTIADVQRTQVGMLERLARIEANKVNEEVSDLRARHDALNGRVDKLEAQHDYEAGMQGARKAIIVYWPALAALCAFILMILMATGIVVLPETQKPPVVVPVPSMGVPNVGTH